MWSLGAIFYELCTGQSLLAQDISDDNLAEYDRDIMRLCTWRCIPDRMLGQVFKKSDKVCVFYLCRFVLSCNCCHSAVAAQRSDIWLASCCVGLTVPLNSLRHVVTERVVDSDA